MKNSKVDNLATEIEIFFRNHKKSIILGGIIGISLTAAYLLSIKKKKRSSSSSKAHEPTLNKGKYIFEIPTDSGNKQAIVESLEGLYEVKMDGKYLGSMWPDENSEKQWATKDKALLPFVSEISRQLSNAFSREGFPALLKGAYSEIILTDWKTSETLEVVISDETDIEVFSTFLKDEISNLVDFKEHLDLIIKKANDAYFVIVSVN